MLSDGKEFWQINGTVPDRSFDKEIEMYWKNSVFVLAALLVAACGGEASEANPAPLPTATNTTPCIPGAQVACACLEGAKGYQICRADGHAFLPCACPGIEDAGNDVKIDSQTDDADAATPDAEIDSDAQAEAEADAQLDVDAGADVEAGSDADAAASSGTLSVTLASNPVSSTIVKKTQNAEALGIQVAAAGGDMMIKSIPLRCQASINGAAYTSADCWKRVTSLAIFDGDTQVGYATSPNTDGKAPILPNYLVAKGVTKDLTVKASFASTASLTEPNDKVSIGIDGDVIAVDTIYNQDVKADVSATLSSTQLSQTPVVATTILPSGTLTIVADGHPSSQIVVAGKDVWVLFARYKATAQYENMKTDRVRAKNVDGGDNADFLQVATASSGVVKGTSVFQAGTTGSTDIDLSGNELIVPKDGYVSFEIWAKLAPVVPSSLVNGAWQGVARSGHAPRLGLDKNFQTGEWDAKYTGKLNVRTTGLVSGERVYADMGAEDGNRMVIRKTKLYFTRLPISTVLTSAEIDLYKWQVGADSAGPAAFKQPLFHVAMTDKAQLGMFRLYRGTSPVQPTDYSIVDAVTGVGMKDSWTGGPVVLATAFATEDVVAGSGNIYTLRTTSVLTSANQSVTVTPITNYVGNPNAYSPFTGQLINNDQYVPYAALPTLFNVTRQGGHVLGTFVWSDQSELPHDASV
ncbi:MAG: hypothetical protein PHC53_04925, partial [Patescibacteria group bacterium]|nr:hypothetical protein [Patescibacteria group bacterium]